MPSGFQNTHEWLEIACEACDRRGRLRKARLIEQFGPDYGVARSRGTLVADCPRFNHWHEPCRAYYVGLNEWWHSQRRK
jgi:hypothetical protein